MTAQYSTPYKSVMALACKKRQFSKFANEVATSILGDAIVKYKCKIKSAHWKPTIQEILEARNDSLIIDCRSSTYQGVWTPPHDRTVEVRVFQVVNGERSVITHMSKKYRGEFVRALLLLKNEPQDIPELQESMQQHFNFDFISATSKAPNYLDLLVSAI